MTASNKKNPESRRIGLIIVNTGNGKGKTTAALGTAFRAIGVGFRVKMIQFIKGSWDYGELHAAAKLGFEIIPMGEGFTWETKNRERDTQVAWRTWETCREAIEKNEHDLLIFDEINNAIAYGYLDPAVVVEALRRKPADMHIILTGRDAHPDVIDVADLVTEMREIKHPFHRGIYAQRGIEY
jgi:cob(I)alamin adenosyltransferase